MKKLLFLSVVMGALMSMNAQVTYTPFRKVSNLEFASSRLSQINSSYIPNVNYTRTYWRFLNLFPDTLACRYRHDMSSGNITKYPTFASVGFTFDPYSFSYIKGGLFDTTISGSYQWSNSYRLDTLSMWADYRLPNGYNPRLPDTLRVYLTYVDQFVYPSVSGSDDFFTINLTWTSGDTNSLLCPVVDYPAPIPQKGIGPLMKGIKRTVDYLLTDKDSILRPSAASSNSHKEIQIPIPHGFVVPPGGCMLVVLQYLPGDNNYNLGDTLDVKYYNGSTFSNQNIKRNLFSISAWDYSTAPTVYALNDYKSWGYNSFYVEDKAIRYKNGIHGNDPLFNNWSVYNLLPSDPEIISNNVTYAKPAMWMSLSKGDDLNYSTYKPCDYDIRSTTYYASVCPGGTYSDAHFSGLMTSGEYHDTLQGVNGCDSIICLMLSIAPLPITYYSASFCKGKNYTDANFTTPISSPGIYYDTLQSLICGDSVVCLTLGYYPDIDTTKYTGYLCSGVPSYTDANFTNISTLGKNYVTKQGSTGCDSVIELTLLSYPAIPKTSYTKYLCYGQSSYSDANFIGVTPGVHSKPLPSKVSGCDSIVELTLIAELQADTFKYAASICQNGSFTDANFSNRTTAGKHYATKTNSKGCDSIIELTLTVASITAYNYKDSICQGGIYNDPMNPKFQNLTQAKQYFDTIKGGNSYGCDSVICLTLSFYKIDTGNYFANFCQGKTYVDANFPGGVTQPGTHIAIVPKPTGCDSVVRLTLSYYPAVTVTYRAATICDGKSYTDPSNSNFTNLTQAKQYYDTIPNVNGCDSVICLTLSYYPPVPIFDYSASFCRGKSYSDANFPNLTQIGTHSTKLLSANGCDSFVRVTLSYYPDPSTIYLPSASICQGESYTDANYNFIGLTQSGTYLDTLRNTNGCDSIIVQLILTVRPVPAKPTITQNGDTLTSSSPVGNQWYFNNTAISGETEQNYTYTQNGTYFVEVTNTYKCASKSDDKIITDVGIASITNHELRIYPNPTDGQLRITNYELRENTVIELFDVYGRKHVSRFTFHNSHIEIDISHLASGMYFLKVNNKVVKVIKN